MESDKPTIEEQITAVLIDMACEQLYMSAKQLQHCMRASKGAKGLVVSADELVRFPKSRFKMDLYYDGECFIYTDEVSKFIIHPNSLVSR